MEGRLHGSQRILLSAQDILNSQAPTCDPFPQIIRDLITTHDVHKTYSIHMITSRVVQLSGLTLLDTPSATLALLPKLTLVKGDIEYTLLSTLSNKYAVNRQTTPYAHQRLSAILLHYLKLLTPLDPFDAFSASSSHTLRPPQVPSPVASSADGNGIPLFSISLSLFAVASRDLFTLKIFILWQELVT